MVKLAVAGGTGNVATEVLRSVIASTAHDITILTRSPISPSASNPSLSYKVVDYNDVPGLVTTLTEGEFEVVLSFLVSKDGAGLRVQKNLIDACVEAGVKRFAPSEWGVKSGSGIPPYKPKDEVAEYLAEINREEKVLEYTLFQPSLFLDYFAHPLPLSPALHTWPFFIDFQHRRAMILDSGTQPIILTAISDISQFVTLALSDPRPWPPIGGIQGTRTSINELVALGQKVRGGEWTIEYLKSEDVGQGVLKSTWVPRMSHPIIPEEVREEYSKEFVIMFLQGIAAGAWDVSREWNERFPSFKTQSAEDYLGKAWEGKE